MAINFPSSPTTGQTYFDGTKYWSWTGYAWKVNNLVADQRPDLSRVDGQNASGTDTLIVSQLTIQEPVASTIQNVDGGSAGSVYLITQDVDGGTASG